MVKREASAKKELKTCKKIVRIKGLKTEGLDTLYASAFEE